MWFELPNRCQATSLVGACQGTATAFGFAFLTKKRKLRFGCLKSCLVRRGFQTRHLVRLRSKTLIFFSLRLALLQTFGYGTIERKGGHSRIFIKHLSRYVKGPHSIHVIMLRDKCSIGESRP